MIYNFFVLLSLWSLIATWCFNPGFVPLGYSYDLTRMNRITSTLYKYVVQY